MVAVGQLVLQCWNRDDVSVPQVLNPIRFPTIGTYHSCPVSMIYTHASAVKLTNKLVQYYCTLIYRHTPSPSSGRLVVDSMTSLLSLTIASGVLPFERWQGTVQNRRSATSAGSAATPPGERWRPLRYHQMKMSARCLRNLPAAPAAFDYLTSTCAYQSSQSDGIYSHVAAEDRLCRVSVHQIL